MEGFSPLSRVHESGYLARAAALAAPAAAPPARALMKARHRSAIAASGRQPLPPGLRLQLRRPPRWEGRRRAGRQRRRQQHPLEHRPCAQQSGLRSRPWRLLSTCSAWGRLHRVDGTLAMPLRRLRAVREPPMGTALAAELSWRGDGARRCAERSPGSPGGEMADLFTWVGRAAHGGHAPRRCRDGYPIPDVGRTTVHVVLVG